MKENGMEEGGGRTEGESEMREVGRRKCEEGGARR